jgi:hypothetical protein
LLALLFLAQLLESQSMLFLLASLMLPSMLLLASMLFLATVGCPIAGFLVIVRVSFVSRFTVVA